ncbi:MAG: alpha-glucan family phosphorylase, partial [Candidatus Peribacteraceae bacterium]|nr:alpha-glucan family phosphorylase [Candidatus Peribacteraceae bacterium]
MSNLKAAYFTMEIGLRADMPTYAGGLGMLAGDMMRSCADMKVPVACVTMCWQHGYMKQTIHPDGSQNYEDRQWNPEDFMKKLDKKIIVTLEGREVTVCAWQLDMKGRTGFNVPIIFLDTNCEENNPADREITKYLYGGDGYMRIKQEAVLGIGGVRMLRALSYNEIGTYHMNEGHAAFLTLELLRERDYQNEKVIPSCAFTTHTPVKAGHDVFSYKMAHQVIGDMIPWHIKELAGEDSLSMTLLAMNLSHYTHGVSKIHGEVSKAMFPGKEIDYITNGIHHLTWACDDIANLLDKYAKNWREDPSVLTAMTCDDIPDEELWSAHQSAKKRLIDEVNSHTVIPFDTDTLTIASARRVVPYKRPELLYENLERLREVAGGKIQIIHAGNAHPSDEFSQSVIQRMVQRSGTLKDSIKIVFLENYNPDLAKLMVSGADVWLNTPMRLFEASGTSGMKACLNGVMNLSTLDGWWIEGYSHDPESGWRIGPLAKATDVNEHKKIDAEDLYTQLQFEVLPEYYYQDRI